VSIKNSTPKIIVHGGAGGWKNKDETVVLLGVREAASEGWRVLSQGGSALDAVEAATKILEDAPPFDAGIGSFLNNQGEVEMDALITDGENIDFGAIAAVQHIRYPISLARLVMTKSKHRFFVAEGAEQFAVSLGVELVPNLTFVTEEEFLAFLERSKKENPEEPGLGTVGAVALDNFGHMASATSTGGSPHKLKGRVGDVPVYGAGGYSDDRIGGASATGIGENIMRHFLSKYTIDLVATGNSPHAAANFAVNHVAEHIPLPEVGIIVIDRNGNLGAAHTTSAMPIGWVDSNGEVRTSMRLPYIFE
jgi:L-asparaginase / beta-aspartyl-peptidase